MIAVVNNTEAIYTRIIGLIATSQTTLKDVIMYKLSSLPTSQFKENGEMRIDYNKNLSKEKIQVEMSSRKIIDANAIFIDGSLNDCTEHLFICKRKFSYPI